ncbi:MAG: hypothetical protein J0H82_29250 [Alphaproteobacteria bacterium]|jgi:hypothetical protein|nr:hypothetical protein [Alphaproteobacteria bacterium]
MQVAQDRQRPGQKFDGGQAIVRSAPVGQNTGGVVQSSAAIGAVRWLRRERQRADATVTFWLVV